MPNINNNNGSDGIIDAETKSAMDNGTEWKRMEPVSGTGEILQQTQNHGDFKSMIRGAHKAIDTAVENAPERGFMLCSNLGVKAGHARIEAVVCNMGAFDLAHIVDIIITSHPKVIKILADMKKNKK